ncbi:MAG TPA: hypothetical protein PKY96_07825 [Flavobacteriales bacterium]|nr:hypothetical protein [Flavobacteriales bacterium]
MTAVLLSATAQAQPAIEWQSTYGGSGDETVRDAVQTPDGGYLLVGHTTSSGGQVTGYQGNEDLWIVKTDVNGVLSWQRALGSGASESGYAVANTADGGWIIAATATDNGGDIASIIGDGDIWLVKLDANGTVAWENTYGGTSFDEPRAVVEVDGGYAVAGYTESDDAQVTGYAGSGDLWVFKVDGTGALLWQRTIGGTDIDEAHGMRRTSDNGVIIAGSTQSSNGDLVQNFGNTDAWLVKLDAAGAIQWNQVYGHTGDEYAMDVVQRTDGGYAFVASTNSQGGQVSQSFGNYDFWLVRTDANGVLEGQSSFGGSGDDMAQALQQTMDGGYVLAGTSVSDNGTVTNPLGGYDFWVVRTGVAGLLQWQRNLGGSDDDMAHAVVQTTDGGYLLAGLTNSNDQDVTNARGGIDFWAVKLQGDNVSVIGLNNTIGTRAFPVPATDRLSIEWAGHVITNWRLLSATGALMAEGRWQNTPIDVAAMQPGLLILELFDAQGERGLVRVMKE